MRDGKWKCDNCRHWLPLTYAMWADLADEWSNNVIRPTWPELDEKPDEQSGYGKCNGVKSRRVCSGVYTCKYHEVVGAP